MAQFHELMKNDLAESSVLCPRLGLNGWGLEGGMRRNIDGRVEDLSNQPHFSAAYCFFYFSLFILHINFVLYLVYGSKTSLLVWTSPTLITHYTMCQTHELAVSESFSSNTMVHLKSCSYINIYIYTVYINILIYP